MARTALIVKTTRKQKEVERRLSQGKKVKFPTRAYNRCKVCGKVHGYMRRFEACRICVRELASEGKIMGMKKASW